MAFSVLDFSGTLPNRRVTVRLDSRTYQIAFQWNERAQRWAFSIFTAANELIRGGIGVVFNRPLLLACQDDRLPDADIVVIDTTNTGEALAFDDFGGRALVLAIEP